MQIKTIALLAIIIITGFYLISKGKNMQAPKAKQIEYISTIHGEKLHDNYAWLRDKNWPNVKTPEILSYLEEENAYYHAHEDKKLEQEIFNELKSRIKDDDQSYPIKKGEFYYYSKQEKGKDYPILYRKNADNDVIILDCNLLSMDKSSFAMGDTEVSQDHSKLAYAYDADGSERYIIHVKDLNNNINLDDKIINSIGNIIWNNQTTGFYYQALDENWRSNRIYFHQLGTNQSQDLLVYQELDLTFSVGISYSSDHEYLLINTGNSTSNEIYYSSLNSSNHDIKLAIKRRSNHLYDLDYLKNKFYIKTNDKGTNFRLVALNIGDNFLEDKFIEIIPYSSEDYLVDVNLYNNFIVITKNILGINHIAYYSIDNYKFIDSIKMPEEIYDLDVIFTTTEDKFLRLHYSSLTTPKTVFEFDFTNQELLTRKIYEIPGYESNFYETKRIWAISKDGTKIPVSIVYRKDLKKSSGNPLLLYGYGSYGYAMPVNFRSNIISLLNRGFIYAIAHIRGGDDLGYDWYESAKFLNKKHTFEDFISVAEDLIKEKYTSSNKLAIMGGSAGGMLMGVVVNERPDLFKSVVALVPFVDVLNTMLDETLPLTPGEFEEWGNPIVSKEFFDYIKSYSPYDNVNAKHYPNMLVTAGLTDPRVGYWEAAKLVAKLRDKKLDDNLLLLKTEMDSGHQGQSGRYNSLVETAMIYSFIIRTIIDGSKN